MNSELETEPMLPSYDTLYLSPHLDDAALSNGGFIFQATRAGRSVLVVTLMAGDAPPVLSGFAQELHERWQLDVDAAAQRRLEDHNACTILGADVLHLAFPDCVYRTHPETGENMYRSRDDIFGAINPVELDEEQGLLADMITRLKELPNCGRVFIPLTIGNHVDHQLTRLAAEKVFDPSQRVYYEDYPYVQWHGFPPQVLGDGQGWQSEVVALDAAAIQARHQAIAAYTSQIPTLFYTFDALAQQLPAHIAAKGGEWLWWKEDLFGVFKDDPTFDEFISC